MIPTPFQGTSPPYKIWFCGKHQVNQKHIRLTKHLSKVWIQFLKAHASRRMQLEAHLRSCLLPCALRAWKSAIVLGECIYWRGVIQNQKWQQAKGRKRREIPRVLHSQRQV